MGESMEVMYQSSSVLSVKLIRCWFTSPVPVGLDLTSTASLYPRVSSDKADDKRQSCNAHYINVIGTSEIQRLVKIFIARTSLPNLTEHGGHRAILGYKENYQLIHR